MNKQINYKRSYKTQRRLASLFVLNVGSQKCESSHCWGPGIRDHFLIHHVISGAGTYNISGKVYRINAGDTFIAYPGITITYIADEYNPWEYLWVGFNGNDASLLLEQTDFSPDSPVISAGNRTIIKKLLLDIYRCHGNRVFESVSMTGSLYLFLSYLIKMAEPRSFYKMHSSEYISRACEYMSDNFSRPISVEDIAHYAGVSRSWLFRSFKQHFLCSPVTYLSKHRIERACILLQNSSLNVKEISCSVGFDDPYYFSRVFKKITGFPPREYAKIHRKHTD